MLKKKYVIPSSAVVKMECAAILAGSGEDDQSPIQSGGDSENPSGPTLIWGEETEKDKTYDPN